MTRFAPGWSSPGACEIAGSRGAAVRTWQPRQARSRLGAGSLPLLSCADAAPGYFAVVEPGSSAYWKPFAKSDDPLVGGEMPRGMVAFLFSDIVGSTQLWEAQAEAMAPAVAEHDQRVRATVDECGGHIFGLGGDGFCVAFESMNDAIQAADSLQEQFGEESLIRIRIGVHVGEADMREGAYFGKEVNKTARVANAGHGGQVLLSDTAVGLTSGLLAKRLGDFRLKGLDSTTTIWQLGENSFPPLRSVDQLSGNIRVPRNAFVGRTAELESISEVLTEHPVCTLVGPGGIGKTRLATQAAAELDSQFPEGAWMVSLAGISDSSVLADSVAEQLSLHAQAGTDPAEALQRWFSNSKVLLVFDNCEHVVDEAAHLVGRLIADASSGSRVLATSQVPLGIVGEQVISLGPLGSEAAPDATIELFRDRARSAGTHYLASADDVAAIAEIGRLVDHVPLAIELAASRVRAMSPVDIAERLRTHIGFLTSGDRLAPDRHRTLNAAMRWSYELLTPDQQMLLRWLSVFAGPCTTDHVVAVVSSEQLEDWLVLDVLIDLVDRSLVTVTHTDGGARYHLLEPVKRFAREELDTAAETIEALGRYHQFFQEHALALGRQLLGSDDQLAFADIEAQWLNIRNAIQAASEDETSAVFEHLYAALGPLWNARGRGTEGARWANVLAGRPVVDLQARAAAVIPAAGAMNICEPGSGMPFIEEAEKIWQTHGIEPPAGATANRALAAMLAGEDKLALELCQATLQFCEQIPRDSWNREHAVNNVLSVLAVLEVDLEMFRAVFDAEMATAREAGSSWNRVTLASTQAHAVGRMGLEDPIGFLDGLYADLVGIGNMQTASHVISAIAAVQMQQGDFAAAATAQHRALELAVDHASGYIEMRLSLAAGVLMFTEQAVASLALGFVRGRQQERGGGPTPQVKGEAFFEKMLRDGLGDRFDALSAEGNVASVDELVPEVLAALQRTAGGGEL